MNFKIANLVDLTSLNDKDTQEDIKKLCDKALKYQVAAVCVYPQFVKLAKQLLQNSQVKIATVANFPKGDSNIEQIKNSIQQSIANGAQEIDLVFPFNDSAPTVFIAECKKICGDNIVLKVILETGSLSPEKIQERCDIAIKAGADFLKTSTGKTSIGATIEAATIILQKIKDSNRKIGFKASGGVRTIEQAEEYIRLADKIMGADWVSPQTFRLGASQLLEAIEA